MAINAPGGVNAAAVATQQAAIFAAQTSSTNGSTNAASPKPAVVAPVATDASAKPVSQSELQQSLEALRKAIKPAVADSLEFSIDHDSGRTVVKVVDTATDTVLRQIPSEDILRLARELDRMQGLLVKQQA